MILYSRPTIYQTNWTRKILYHAISYT